MKQTYLTVIALLCLLLTIAASAETRALDLNMRLTSDKPAYRLHWPLTPSNAGWHVAVDRPDGTPYFTGTIADPEARPLLDKTNRRGAFVFYYDNGQAMLKGRYDDAGLIAGRARVYHPNGRLKEIRNYEPTGYDVIRAYHPDGSLAIETLPNQGKQTARSRRYREDGSLLEERYTVRNDHDGSVEIVLKYDRQHHLVERYKIRPDVQINETLENGRIVERLTTHGAQARRLTTHGNRGWSLHEFFNEAGQLIQRDRHLLPGYEKDGKQIHTYDDGVRRISRYHNGQQDGPFQSRRGDTWLKAGAYKNDQPVGRWFEVDDDSGDVRVTRYDDAGQYLGGYRIDAALVAHDANGKPTLADTLTEVRRTLPPPGTIWAYQHNDAAPVTLTLEAVDDGTARYDVDDGQSTLAERINRYQPIDAKSGPALRFPLHPGDTWQYDSEQIVRVPVEDDAHWQYRYRAHVTNHVAAVEKIHVGAGTFTTLRISRETTWQKDRPQGEGGRLDTIENGGDGVVEGFTRDLLWYAPKAGRVVLKAHMESGNANVLDRDAADLLDNAATWFTELVALTGPGEQASPAEPQYARAPQAGWIGFTMRRNNTWEYLMQSHRPGE